MPRPRKQTRAEIEREAEKERQAETEYRRKLCYVNLFWMDCEQKRCRRVRKCAGNPRECFDRKWRAMTEQERVFRREFITALWERRETLEQALASGAARERDYVETEARRDARSVKGTREEPAQSSAYTRV